LLIFLQRIQRLKMRYKILDQKGLNFLTLTIVDWIDLFTRKQFCEMVLENLQYCRREKGLLIFAYVIMSSHLHLIVKAGKEKDLSDILKEFKSFTARQIIDSLKKLSFKESRKEWLLEHFKNAAGQHSNKSVHKVWQDGNRPIELYTPKVIRQKLIYIHRNPVVSGIVNAPEDYLYSSASNYLKGHLPEEQKNCKPEIDLFEGIWSDEGFSFMGNSG